MSFVSIDDVLLLGAFVLPGYIALTVFFRVSLAEYEIKENQLMILSIVLSLIFWSPYVINNQIISYEDVKNTMLLFRNWYEINLFGAIGGFVTALFYRIILKKGVVEGYVWSLFFKNIPEKGAWVSVLLKNNREIAGKISKVTESQKGGDIILFEPVILIRNKKGEPIHNEKLGRSIIILKSDIIAVTFVAE